MKEVLPGIYQITLTLSGFSPGSVNTYLVRDHNHYAIIDTGWDSPPSVESMEAQLSEIGASLADIKQVIITHCHIDHFGLTAKLKKEHQARVYLHQKEMDLIKIRFSGGDNFLPLTDKFLQNHGVPASELPPPEIQIPISNDLISMQADVWLVGGEISQSESMI